jgi:hypothetical protein
MDVLIKAKLHRFGAWCGAGYVVAILIGWALIANFLFPPHRPTASAEQIVAIFQENTTKIRIGMLFIMLAALLMVPFTGAIVQTISRVEGGVGMLSWTALLGGVGNMVLTFYPATWWLVAAYRPDRGAGYIYLMNDIAWLQFIGGVTMFLALPLSFGVAGLVDHRPDAVVPRWAGYLNIWVCILIIPDQLLFFFQTGPFAWNGLFGLWLPLVAFFGWFAVTVYLTRRATPHPGSVSVLAEPSTAEAA